MCPLSLPVYLNLFLLIFRATLSTWNCKQSTISWNRAAKKGENLFILMALPNLGAPRCPDKQDALVFMKFTVLQVKSESTRSHSNSVSTISLIKTMGMWRRHGHLSRRVFLMWMDQILDRISEEQVDFLQANLEKSFPTKWNHGVWRVWSVW